ncbi:MAG TPA: hypothetical protein VFJ15_14160 [Oleiagrimonas sp.]|nr:hypothetical protein [Oleiagrimonas sp.]
MFVDAVFFVVAAFFPAAVFLRVVAFFFEAVTFPVAVFLEATAFLGAALADEALRAGAFFAATLLAVDLRAAAFFGAPRVFAVFFAAVLLARLPAPPAAFFAGFVLEAAALDFLALAALVLTTGCPPHLTAVVVRLHPTLAALWAGGQLL